MERIEKIKNFTRKQCGRTIVALFLICNSASIWAADSDSLTVSSRLDSTFTKKKKSALSSKVQYWADDILLSDHGHVITLKNNAKIIYETMTLTAGHIKINQNEKKLYAWGLRDSLDADSNWVVRAKPVFDEKGQEPLRGDSIEYNFETERGKITMGKTEMEPGYYRGKKIYRIADSTMLVKDGIFTSCENIDHPHYYFQSNKIRLKVKDKVIAEPIVFYIADVPLAWMPFGVFPNKRGRHSGIITPSYGQNRTGGRFLRGMGYYWAPNDYFDATMLVDYYDKLDFAYRASARYIKRYSLNGSVSAEYYPRDPRSGGNSERWQFRFNHRQIIDPTMSLSGSGSFVSDRRFSRELSPNVDDRLNQNITSSMNFSKRWKGSKNSLSASVSRNENLQTGRVSYTLPSVSFNRGSSTIYETLTGERLSGKRNWYQNIFFSYNSSLIRKGAKIPATDSTFTESLTQGIQHRMSFSSPQKLFKYISLNPSLSFKEDWVDEIQKASYNEETQLIETKKIKQFAASHTFSASVNAKTTVYGLFEPNMGSFKYLRHKMDPSVSFSYTPDFSSPFYGYFDSVRDSNGVVQKKDKFAYSPYGGTGSRESRRMSLRLGNIFQGKFIDENGKETKRDLMTINFASAYDFMADSLGWSNITTNFRTKLFGKNISVRMVHDIYQTDAENHKINKFKPYPELLSLNTSFGFTINNKTFSREKEKPKEQKNPDETEGILKDNSFRVQRRDLNEETKNISIPWSTNFSLTYSYNRERIEPQNIDLSARANFQLTRNWKISWNARIDLKEMDVAYQSFNIYRDLHCWEMSFGWQPTRDYYDFRINIKSSALQDIKLTRHPARSSYLR